MTKHTEHFFRQHPVFTRQRFDESRKTSNKNTSNNVLAHHLRQKHIVRIKRGLFASIPYGADPQTYSINPYLIANAASADAIISHHTALSYYGLTYSASYRFIYLTETKAKPFNFQGISYQPSLYPAVLISYDQKNRYVNKEDVQGVDIAITTKERTLVDVLDRPLLGGGWEEIWRSLEMIEYMKIEDVIGYALLLGNATTIAKVGFYLEKQKSQLGIDDEQLKILEQYRPKSLRYMDNSNKKNCICIHRWNLMVPESIINQHWEENLSWEPKI